MSMAAFLTGGDCRAFRGIRSTVKALFDNGDGRVPAHKFDGKQWIQGNNWQIMHVIERLYDLCWDAEAAQWARLFGSDYGRYFYFSDGGTGQPASLFRKRAARKKQDAERIRRVSNMPKTGDDLSALSPNLYYAYPYVDGNWWSMGYDNGRCGGVVNSPARYFHEDGRTGLPAGVAALVSHVERDWYSLHLYNANAEPVRLWLTGGLYGTHRIQALKIGETAREVGSPRVLIELPPKHGARLDVIIARYAYRPSACPWKYTGQPAETLPQDADLRLLLSIPF